MAILLLIKITKEKFQRKSFLQIGKTALNME